MIKNLENPGSEFRGAPFWAWNGKLEPEVLREQIRMMKSAGLGGFFMHSRVGLDTAYLSADWFRCVDACIDEAKKLDMNAWLYDEDRWPSGAAGGLVTKNPKYRMRRLHITTSAAAERSKGWKFAWSKECVAVFTGVLDGEGKKISRLKQCKKGSPVAPKSDETLFVFECRLQECTSWFNNFTYLDTMNPEAVREFIRVTYEKYHKECGKFFGNIVPGIFTDEPDHYPSLDERGEKLSLMWTDKFPQEFRKRWGYDVLPHLLEMVWAVEGANCERTRWHFHETGAELFTKSFTKQIGDWCGKHKLQFTGHLMEEDSLVRQTRTVGSCMRSYEYMQAPGMDMLTENWRIFQTAKQVSSAAHQFGREWRLTETYGCTGWDFPFAGHKALGDWQLALGINFRCQHLSWYTMKGEAKRDYPAGIFYQSPWWSCYNHVEDYFARVNTVMTRGEEVRDVLFLHPNESAWILCRKGWEADKQAGSAFSLDADFTRTTDALLAAHLDFDYADEEIMSRHARVVSGESPRIALGKAIYRMVVVPSVHTLRATTMRLLKKFREAGGVVVFAGDLPKFVDAIADATAAEFAQLCSIAPTSAALVREVESISRRVSIADVATGKEIAPALYLLREDKEAAYLFVCNTGEDFTKRKDTSFANRSIHRKLAFDNVKIKMCSAGKGQPIEIDAVTGIQKLATAQASGDGWEIATSLPALGSRLFIFPKNTIKGKEIYAPAMPRLEIVRKSTILAPARWQAQLSEANVAVLDRPRYSIGTGKAKWQPVGEILEIDNAVRETLGAPSNSGRMAQPWTRSKPAHPKRIPVALEYEFFCEALPTGDLFLALENPQCCRISLNGEVIKESLDCGWWVDTSLRKMRLDPAALRLGRNTIHIAVDYDETNSGLEIVYLLGTFGVKLRNQSELVLAKMPTSLAIGDWCKQGLPFYAGHVAYSTRIVAPKQAGRTFVRIPDYRGVAVRVRINGKVVGLIAWEPNELDITDFIEPGKFFELSIEVLGHRRNSHGPFHYEEKWPSWSGPSQYRWLKKEFVNLYQLVPCGLMAAPEILVKAIRH